MKKYQEGVLPLDSRISAVEASVVTIKDMTQSTNDLVRKMVWAFVSTILTIIGAVAVALIVGLM
jgi:hypothetical protein